MKFPEWFYTRASGLGLLLVAVTAWRLCLDVLQAETSLVLIAVLTVLTIASGAMALTLWLSEFREPHDYDEWRALRWFGYATLLGITWIFWASRHSEPWWKLAGIAAALFVATRQLALRSTPVPGERLRHEPRLKAYLVLTVDLRHDPPVATRCAIFSVRGRDLTSLCFEELNVTVESREGDSFEEAKGALEHDVRLYWPKLAALLDQSYPRSRP